MIGREKQFEEIQSESDSLTNNLKVYIEIRENMENTFHDVIVNGKELILEYEDTANSDFK